MKSNAHSSSCARDEAIEATAAAWLAERDGGLSAEDTRAFEAWCAADVRHEAAIRRLEQTWNHMQALREFRPDARVHPDRDLLARPVRRSIVRWPAIAAATALAACLTIAFNWASTPEAVPPMPQHKHYATTVGGYQRMTLPDGSIVELNADTEISERFTAGERRVLLLRGEATFQVTKNPRRPFVVIADGVAVRAVGTAFNVRLRSGSVDVLVTEGRVRVDLPAGMPRAPTIPELIKGDRVTLPTESGIEVNASPVQSVTPAAMRDELAWQERKLEFVETPLAEVVRQFNARNRVQLELADPSLGTIPVGGSFRADNVDGFVRLLATSEQIESEQVGEGRILLRRAR